MEITAVKSAKKLQRILRNAQAYLGGGRFPRTNTLHIFKSEVDDQPFLLLDYAGPMEFPPTEKRLGVGEHPHRGFETVTIVYSSEVEHRG